MFLAVKLAESCPSAAARGMPKAWPIEAKELKPQEVAPGGPWVIMTPAALAAHKAKHRAAYDAWLAAQPVEGE